MTIEELISEAELHLQKREIDEALSKFQKAFEVLPKEAHLASQIGVCYFHLNKHKESLDFMNLAVNLQPDYSYRYSSRAYILAANNQLDAAISDYEMCVKLDPEDAVAHNNLGLLQEQKGWKKQAETNFNKADELEGILKERGIETVQEIDEPEVEKKSNSERSDVISELQKETPAPPQSVLHVMKEVFTDKKTFKEFIKFVKSGFKIPDNE